MIFQRREDQLDRSDSSRRRGTVCTGIRLVGLGNSQVPGVGHKFNLSLVVSDITFRYVYWF